MRILVVGAGKVGSTLTATLVREGHDVTVIDSNEEKLAELGNQYDIMTVSGNGGSKDVLEQASAKYADMVIAATSADEVNILACFVAHELGAKRTIARVRNPEYRSELELIKEKLGLTMIVNPERSAANEISRILRFPSANDIEVFCRGRVELVEYNVSEDSPLCNLSLMDLYRKYQIKILVCAVQRGDEVIVPKGDFVLRAGDRINITANPKEMSEFFKSIGAFVAPVKNIIVIGASMISYHVAVMLMEMGMNVKIIEKDEKRCEEFSEMLPKATIVCADATEKDLLLEEGIMNTDAVLAMTNLDEMNIIYAMYAKAKGVKKVIAKVHHLTFPEVIEDSGIESVISPKYITAERISSYIRAVQNSLARNKIESLRLLVDGKIEAIEFVIRDDDFYVGIPLKDLRFRDNALIAAIVRHGTTIIPGGSDCIEHGDSVIVVTANMTIEDLGDIIKK